MILRLIPVSWTYLMQSLPPLKRFKIHRCCNILKGSRDDSRNRHTCSKDIMMPTLMSRYARQGSAFQHMEPKSSLHLKKRSSLALQSVPQLVLRDIGLGIASLAPSFTQKVVGMALTACFVICVRKEQRRSVQRTSVPSAASDHGPFEQRVCYVKLSCEFNTELCFQTRKPRVPFGGDSRLRDPVEQYQKHCCSPKSCLRRDWDCMQ